MGNHLPRNAEGYAGVAVESSPDLMDGVLGLVLHCPRSCSGLRRNQKVRITVEPHVIRFDPAKATRADRAVRAPLFATSHLQVHGWSVDLVQSTFSFSTSDGSSFTLQVHNPSRISNAISKQEALAQDQLNLSPTVVLCDQLDLSSSAVPAVRFPSAAQRIRSASNMSTPRSSPQITGATQPLQSAAPSPSILTICPARRIKSDRMRRLSMRNVANLRNIVSDLNSSGISFHTPTPTDLTGLTKLIHTMNLQLAELQRRILSYDKPSQELQKAMHNAERHKGTHGTDVFEQMVSDSKKMDDTIEHLMDMTDQLRKCQSGSPPSPINM